MKLKNALIIAASIAVVGAGFTAYAQTIKGKDLPTGETVQNINDLKYPLEAWDPQLLAMVDHGPYLLKGIEIAVPPPPANDSEETKAELELLRKYMREARTEEEVAQIMKEHKGQLDLDVPNIESVMRVGAMADNELKYYLMKAKKDYARARPTQLAPDLTTLFDVPPHAAYPSGHATQAHLAALVLGYIDEPRKEKLWTYADDVARRREIAGVHYPSDSKAGADLATAIFDNLLKNAEFKTAIDKAKDDFIAQNTH